MLKIGILREGKTPPDARTPLTPAQCKWINTQQAGKVYCVVQSSKVRCIADADYAAAGIEVVEDISDCDILLGIKEVPIKDLIAEKTYFFFSHTIKKQAHNQKLLRAVLDKGIELVDYECLTNDTGLRVIAFGRWAGIVGAHNGLMTYSRRTKAFDLKQMHQYGTFAAALEAYKNIQLPRNLRIVVTGAGRVSSGALEVLDALKIRQVSPSVFLANEFEQPVYTQVNAQDYAQHKQTGHAFEISDFFENPQNYESTFLPYAERSDLMINGIFWDKRAPAFFTREQMLQSNFRLRTIADITCDIAPAASLPSTLKASTIAEPIFGYDAQNNCETAPHQPHVIDVMSIDNLPSELPIDASGAFGEQFIKSVLGELLHKENSAMLRRATISNKQGQLTAEFAYLQDYAEGK